jgi:alanyl-tRNA synthetase
MDSIRIRRTFLDFFAEKGHVVRPSASLIPTDPTLLLTNAGMVPFKPYFLGEEDPPYRRAASIQKCIRTVDIDVIGTTVRHFSFFEMMGNFSFGDYFKKEAMEWAVELLVERYGLDFDRLWFTAYEEDDEAAELWIEHVGAPPERVQRGGRDNFWQMGVPGPCGPCAEIFYDRGPSYGPDGGPIGGGEERFIEIWNLVFMQYIQDEPYHVVGDLPTKNIDTGMGLERLAMILQGVESGFDTDTVRPVREAAATALGVTYGDSPDVDVSLRILADHGRAFTFLIADGVIPSNDGRGYVLRRLVRRAVRHAWRLGSRDQITPRLVDATTEAMGGWYPELATRQDFVKEVVSREEHRFRRTLESGMELLEAELASLGPGEVLPGEVAFKLHDTYGFPVELTSEIAEERGVGVDRSGFEAEMERQRERARKAWRGGEEAAAAEVYRRLLDRVGPTEFVGYEKEADRGRILAIVSEGEQVARAEEGRPVEVFVDRTPFYAEAGGQVGDTGVIRTDTGLVEVSDTKHAVQGFHGHRGKVVKGHIEIGQDAELQIDSPRRERIRRSHTGTHVLHYALRAVLGDHASQAGSLVEAGRLRFDFSHYEAPSDTELGEVEELANLRLIENADVTTAITSREQAEKMGALAFFGEKYGEEVRVVKVGDYSIELCGGTHTRTSGEVGPLIVVSESSIGANLRRVEALTGDAAYRHLVGLRRIVEETGGLLRAQPAELPRRAAALLERLEHMEHRLEQVEARERAEHAASLASTASQVGEAKLVVASVDRLPPDELRRLALAVRERLGSGVVVLGSSPDGKGALVAAVTPDLKGRVSAGEILAEPARRLGGGGSRDPELAQAGGPQGDKLAEALDVARETLARLLGS